MRATPLPERLDCRDLAKRGAHIDGCLPIAAFTRLARLIEDGREDVTVRCSASFDAERRIELQVAAKVRVLLECQNCLQPFEAELAAETQRVVVDGEEGLDTLEPDQDGVAAEGRLVNLLDLVEDELLLGMPMAPRHPEEICGSVAEPRDSSQEDTYRPFAALGAQMQARGKQST